MADFPMSGRGYAYQGYQQPPMQHPQPVQPSNNPVKAVAALTGSALSLALLVGAGAWGYQLIARDVAGVPVVRAVQGEMRIRPADPGGSEVLNQGLAVNNVAAAGGTAGFSDRIVLAPEPIDLASEKAPLIDQLAATQPRFVPSKNEANSVVLTAPIKSVSAEMYPKMLSIQALANQIAAGAKPLTRQVDAVTALVVTSVANVAPTPIATDPQPLSLSQNTIDASIPGISISMRPKTRPYSVRTASLNRVVATSNAREIDPASILAGTRLVQLGAYESPEIARKEWERFSVKFADYMSGKDRVVQRASSGGRIFYRLRAKGFSDLADARRFCSALTARNTDCIPVVTR